MKSFSAFITLALCLLMAGTALAAPTGKLVKDPNGGYIQAHSPYPPASVCTSITATKGTIATISSLAGYSQLSYAANDGTGAALIVKRHWGSNTAFMPKAADTIGINSDMSSAVFKKYSTQTATTAQVCYELTRGGKTP